MADHKEEDKSLEDFFSKKEKSKKTKSKCGEKKQVKTKARNTTQKKSTSSAQNEKEVVDQEWEDFKDPEEKDYTGLRIQALQIVEGEKEKDEETPTGDFSDDVNGQVKKESAPGVWSKASGQPQPGTTQVMSDTEKQAPSRYVPGSFGRRRKPMNPPDIDSQAAFPTLGSSVIMDKQCDKGKGDFEMVKKGTKSKDGAMTDVRPRLDLENRFDTLRN